MNLNESKQFLEVDITQNEEIIGGLFLQCLTCENRSPAWGVESLGSLNIVRGRYVLGIKDDAKNGWKKNVPFECSVAFANQVSVKRYHGEEIIREDIHILSDKKWSLPKEVLPKEVIIIKALQFPAHCPVESMTTEIIIGNYLVYNEDLLRVYGPDHYRFQTKTVLTTQTTVAFRPYDSIKVDAIYGKNVCVQEVLFDKMTLNTFSVLFPKPSPSAMPSSPNYRNLEANASSSTKLVAIEAYELWYHKLYRQLLVPYVLDCLLALTVLCIYLIYHINLMKSIENVSLFYILTSNGHWFLGGLLLVWIVKFAVQAQRLRAPRSNGRSFFVNGWQAWSFTGTVMQGHPAPLYSMPHAFVESFHHGGEGSALPINQGYGTLPYQHTQPIPLTNSHTKQPKNRTLMSSVKNNFYLPTHRDFIGSDMFSLLVDTQNNCALMLGFLSQKQYFSSIGCNVLYDQLSVHVSGDGMLLPREGGKVCTDPFIMYTTTDLAEPLKVYMEISSLYNKVHELFSGQSSANKMESGSGSNKSKNSGDGVLSSSLPVAASQAAGSSAGASLFHPYYIPSGWCSWYHFFEHINEANLVSNIQHMKNLQSAYQLDTKGFSLFQIDDGYQLHWGDWLDIKPSFNSSRSLSDIANDIRKNGLVGGIWLAPFACDKNSNLYKDHPEWILYQASKISYGIFTKVARVLGLDRLPCNSANCGKFFYGIDLTLPSVRKHLHHILTTVTQVWGFRYLKLDFLYACALKNADFFDRSKSRAQVFSMGMDVVREGVKSKDGEDGCFLLGCGAPLGGVIGCVHANRISADAGLTWLPSFPLPSSDKWNLPCARNMLRNTLSRMYLHNMWFICDPDCVIVRDALSFSVQELSALGTVKLLSGGSLVLSDDIQAIGDERREMFSRLLPATNQAATSLDLCLREIPELVRAKIYKRKFTTSNVFRGQQADVWTAFDANGTKINDNIPPPPAAMGEERAAASYISAGWGEEGGSMSRINTYDPTEFPLPPGDDPINHLVLPASPLSSRTHPNVHLPSPPHANVPPAPPFPSPPHRSTSDPTHYLRMLQSSFQPLKEVNEDHVLDSAFPSPTVYTRKRLDKSGESGVTSDSGNDSPGGARLDANMILGSASGSGGKATRIGRAGMGVSVWSVSSDNEKDNEKDKGVSSEADWESEGDSPKKPLPLCAGSRSDHAVRGKGIAFSPAGRPRRPTPPDLDSLVPVTIVDEPRQPDDEPTLPPKSFSSSVGSMGGEATGFSSVSGLGVGSFFAPLRSCSSDDAMPRPQAVDVEAGVKLDQEDEASAPSERLKEALKRHFYDARDLHAHWFLFGVGNWGESASGSKSHFVQVMDILGEEEAKCMRDYLDLLYNRKRFLKNFQPKDAAAASGGSSSRSAKGRRVSRGGGGHGGMWRPAGSSSSSLSLPVIHHIESLLAHPFGPNAQPYPYPSHSHPFPTFSRSNSQHDTPNPQPSRTMASSLSLSLDIPAPPPPPPTRCRRPQPYRNPLYLVVMHMFGLGAGGGGGSYAYRKVSLLPAAGEDREGRGTSSGVVRGKGDGADAPATTPLPDMIEVPFLDLPPRSMSLYHISLSLHPMRPLYLGMRMGRAGVGGGGSGGGELRAQGMRVVKNPQTHKHALVDTFQQRAKLRKRSRSSGWDDGTTGKATTAAEDLVTRVASVAVEFEDGVVKTGGEMFIFLPINFNIARKFNHLLGGVEVSGTARSGFGRGAGLPKLVCYVEERDCYTAGYVIRIPLRVDGAIHPSASADQSLRGDHVIISWIYDVKGKSDDLDEFL